MVLQVLRQVANSLHTAPFLTINMDESTNVSNKEQLVICFQWVDSSLEAHEDFVELYHLETTQASVIVTVACDVLQKLNISITQLTGQFTMVLHPCLELQEE